METTLEQLIEERRNRDAVNREYVDLFLHSKLSVAIDHCFNVAQKWSYNIETLQNFRRYIDELGGKLNILSKDKPVSLLRIEAPFVVERLQHNQSLSDMQKKLRMHALMFLFSHLEKETGGAIRALKMPTEFKMVAAVQEDSKKSANWDEVHEILQAATAISNRDSLVLKLIFETEHSLHDILNLNCDALNFEDRLIAGIKPLIDSWVMTLLKEYVESTNKIRGDCPKVFISNQGKPLHRTQVQKTLDKANTAANLPYRITTKMIQRSKQSEKLNWET